MKTVFKEGMEVWDKTISPNKGKVIEAFADTKFDFPIKVEFEDGLKVQYTNDGCFVKSKGAINTLSTSNYSIDFKGFEQKESVPTFEEAVDWLEKNSKDRVIYADEAYINEEYELAFKALKKLTILRDYYNEGYNFELLKNEYCAVVVQKIEDPQEVAVRYIKNSQRLLFFKSREIANKFLKEQIELLKAAKPLL